MYIIIPTHNEESVYRILPLFNKDRMPEDKIIILDDYSNEEYFTRLSEYAKQNNIEIHQHALNKDFGAHWNYIYQFIPDNEWVVWFAADEIVDDNFLELTRSMLVNNAQIEQFWMPRVNTFYDETIEEFSMPNIDWANPVGQMYPDYQGRIHRNLPHIKWFGKVHEMLVGARSTLILSGKEYTIIHHRSHQKCEMRDILYKEIGHPVYNKQ